MAKRSAEAAALDPLDVAIKDVTQPRPPKWMRGKRGQSGDAQSEPNSSDAVASEFPSDDSSHDEAVVDVVPPVAGGPAHPPAAGAAAHPPRAPSFFFRPEDLGVLRVEYEYKRDHRSARCVLRPFLCKTHVEPSMPSTNVSRSLMCT